MKKPVLLLCAALVMTVMSAQAETNHTTKKNTKNNDPKCPDIELRREVPDGQRYAIAMIEDDPVYLSAHYCFGFWKVEPPSTAYDLPTKYTFDQTRNLFKRYHATYDSLEADEEKIAFAHLYLKHLSEQSLVLPKAVGDKTISYIMPTLEDGRVVMFASTIATDDYYLIYDGLMALADKPPIDKDWPKLVKLVDLVLTNLDSKVAQTIEEDM